MDKFKVGDKVDRVHGLRSFQKLEGGGPYTVTAVSPSARFIQINLNNHYGDPYPWDAQNFKLVEQDDPLPPAPGSALYVNKWRWGVGVRNLGDEVQIGTGNPNSRHGWTYATLDPDSALQLAHDLTRMAMEIKRKEKQNA